MHVVRIQAVRTHGPRLKTFSLPRLFEASPGQFVMLWLPGVEEKPFSISGLGTHTMDLTVKEVGPFTEALGRCAPGDWVGIRGPFGRGFQPVDRALLVAGGTGAAPLRFLAQVMEARGLSFSMLCGAKTALDLPFREDLERWGCDLATEDGSCGSCGLVTQLAEAALSTGSFSCVCGAGPEPMLLRLARLADEAGLPYQLSFERYMKCGIGLCGSCCLDGSGIRLCVEGPVLTPEEVRGVTEWGLPPRDASGRRPV